ncbi:MAG: hypothetical protein SGI72_06325 [Planctomycetota bacterium]|nr:hypothetical protein [Planctomycetota bacterium]
MISELLLCIVPQACIGPASHPSLALEARGDTEVDAQIHALGRDVPKLLELAGTFATAGRNDAAKKVYLKILEIDVGNEDAHKALNHQFYDKKWFESFAELAKYKREEAAKMKTKGLVRWKEDWVAENDLTFLRMGWTKEAAGVWANPNVVAREKQAADWKAAGHQFRADDNSWIAPDDMAKWTAVLWKCGDQWLDTAQADEYHSKIEQSWELMGEHFEVWTTCEWDTGKWARWHAEKAYPELVRIFGVEPKTKPHFFVLKSLEQYNQAAGQTPILIESEGISSLHGAYFADAFFDMGVKPPLYLGCGVSYWDRKDPKLDSWGPKWLRFAAGQSFVEAIDPSWTAISEWVAQDGRGDFAKYSGPFWGEKKIPRWLRYGAASYVERFMKNPEVADGVDPWNLRAFAFEGIKKAGGLSKLDDVFAFKLDIQDIPGSERLYQDAGLVVAYLLDGAAGDKELADKHAKFQAALKSGAKTDVTAAVTTLQKALAKHERNIKKFAGL